MRIVHGAFWLGSAVGLALIAPQSSAQYLGVPYYGQPPPYHGTQQPPAYGTFGTRETPYHEAHHMARHRHLSEDAVLVTARAPEQGESRIASLSREVAIGDLDLRSRSGSRELHSRISLAASTLCSRLNAPRDSDCYDDAVRDAMAQARGSLHAGRSYGGY
ncbi:MAG TPA: UrcA family protein [Rhizomicrobium sp.]|nr:UrcA family protein [Rhizomicrobium sp.]